MYDRNEIKEIIDEIVFLKKYTLFDKQEYDEKAKVASRITTKVEVVDGKNVKTRVFKKSGNEVK